MVQTRNRNYNSIDNLTKARHSQEATIPGNPAIRQQSLWRKHLADRSLKNKLFIFGAYEYTHIAR